MKALIRKIARYAKFSADVVAISQDVTGLITDVPVHDNQLVKKGDTLFIVDRPRYQKVLDEAPADVEYYQALVSEKRREAARRNQLGTTVQCCAKPLNSRIAT